MCFEASHHDAQKCAITGAPPPTTSSSSFFDCTSFTDPPPILLPNTHSAGSWLQPQSPKQNPNYHCVYEQQLHSLHNRVRVYSILCSRTSLGGSRNHDSVTRVWSIRSIPNLFFIRFWVGSTDDIPRFFFGLIFFGATKSFSLATETERWISPVQWAQILLSNWATLTLIQFYFIKIKILTRLGICLLLTKILTSKLLCTWSHSIHGFLGAVGPVPGTDPKK